MNPKNWILNYLEARRADWTRASDFLWDHPEVKFEEYQAADLLSRLLENDDFRVKRGIADIETAFLAEYGTGEGPVIAFLGEYDALPHLSQTALVLEALPIKEGGNGHGCGHNLLGVGSLAAALALKAYLKEHHLPGIIRYYGCPAEEGGSGKTFMVRAGAFQGTDAVLTWHPAVMTGVWSFGSLANVQARFRFQGKSAHAASAPHLGRSALDAVELMNVGVNYLREHMIDEARIHYAVTDTGGESPNVVQAHAEVIQLIRAPRTDQAMALYERVQQIAKGAALMTGTEVEVDFDKAASNYIPNDRLGQVMGQVIQELGPPSFSEEDMELARSFQGTLTEADIQGASQGMEALRFALQKPLSDRVIPYFKINRNLPGSTDVGDVSWVAPTVQAVSACYAVGTGYHTWQLTAQGKAAYAQEGMLHAARIMALTAQRLLEDPRLIEEAKEENKDLVYQSPLPEGVKPGHLREGAR